MCSFGDFWLRLKGVYWLPHEVVQHPPGASLSSSHSTGFGCGSGCSHYVITRHGQVYFSAL